MSDDGPRYNNTTPIFLVRQPQKAKSRSQLRPYFLRSPGLVLEIGGPVKKIMIESLLYIVKYMNVDILIYKKYIHLQTNTKKLYACYVKILKESMNSFIVLFLYKKGHCLLF